MEEPRPGQKPTAEHRPPSRGVYERAAPPMQESLPSAKEREQIAQARKRGKADQEELRATGHGDHKGVEGF